MKDPAKVTCRIFVGNLPTDDMERKDLKDLFSKFGLVTGMNLKLINNNIYFLLEFLYVLFHALNKNYL